MAESTPVQRSRGWCLTLNNYSEADEHACFELQLNPSVKYAVAGREVGESGTPHLQMFIYFTNPQRFGTVKELFPRAHIEVMRGTTEEAATYCMKEGDFFECGEKPATQKEKGERGEQAIAERWALAKAGKFEELPPEQIKTYEYIYRKNMAVANRDTLDNVWIHGPSGAGKSRYVRETYTTFYSKGMNKWWDGYEGEDVVVLDDFDPSHGKYLAYFLKIWTDHYSFNAEVKGGMLHIRPKVVIVTSQYSIAECFEEPQAIEAISRRFQVKPMGVVMQRVN